MGRSGDAIAAIRQNLSWLERRFGNEHLRTASAQMQLAMLLEDDAHFDEARRLAEMALQSHLHLLGPSHPLSALQENNLGALLSDQQLYPESLGPLEKALRVVERQPDALAFGPIVRVSTGRVLLRLGRDVEARQQFERALELTRRTSERVLILTGLAELDHRAGDDAKSLDELARALTLVKPTEVEAADPLRLNADIEFDRGNAARALELDRRALALIEHFSGPHSFQAAPMLRGIGAALLALGDRAGAEAALSRALPLVSALPGGGPEKKRVEKLLARARGSAPQQ
jgi:tetratricopeptide (TPR) repeat protein